MTIAQLLGINPRLLDTNEKEGLRLAERLFSEAGAPIDRRALYAVLEQTVTQIHRQRDRGSSIRYPRFLYGKFKDLKRGLWEPQAGALAVQIEQEERALAALNIARPAKSEEELIAEKRASLTPKDFEAWMRLHAQGRSITAEADKSVIPIEKGRKAYG